MITIHPITFASVVLSNFIALAAAQSSTVTWSQAPVCTNGLSTPSAQNGTYTDKYGATWAVQCGQDSTGFVYDSYEGTNGQGPYGCFKGCDSRPRCTAFMFQGTVTGASPPQGSGRCYYKTSAGTYYTNSSVYAAANLISNGTPNLVCPYYNGTTYAASDNSVWQVYCGFDTTAVGASTAQGTSGSIAQCMAQCNGISDCTLLSYTYTGGEPTDGSTNADGTCYYKKGTYQVYGSGTATVAAVIRIGTATSGTTTYFSTSSSSVAAQTSSVVSVSSAAALVSAASSMASSSSAAALINVSVPVASIMQSSTVSSPPASSSTATSSSAAAASSGCNLAPVPSAPVCPSANQQAFTDACGTNYTVYCGYDTNPGAASTTNAYSLSQCMQACDNYPGCQSATWSPGSPGTCYIKTGFTGTYVNANVQALVRYIPPNPAYYPPTQAPGVNTSSGCGSSLPGGLTAGGSSVLFNFINPTDGLQRNYTIHIPQYYNPNYASPVIFAFPGNGEGASNIEQETGLSSANVNPYAITVYVNGYGLGFASNPRWGVPGAQYGFVDDIGFMQNLIPNITASFCVDTGRIWATGHSNGGGFVNVMACDPVLSGLISVFTANSAACYTNLTSGDPASLEPLNTPVQSICNPSRNNLPFLEMHGTNDTTINYYGGPRNNRILPTIPHLMTDWAIRDGIGATNVTTQIGPNATQYSFNGNPNNPGQITQLTLLFWVHQWPTLAGGAPVEGSSMIMPFFYQQSNYSRAAVVASNSSSSSVVSSSTVSALSSSSSILVSTTSASQSIATSSVISSSSSGMPTSSSSPSIASSSASSVVLLSIPTLSLTSILGSSVSSSMIPSTSSIASSQVQSSPASSSGAAGLSLPISLPLSMTGSSSLPTSVPSSSVVVSSLVSSSPTLSLGISSISSLPLPTTSSALVSSLSLTISASSIVPSISPSSSIVLSGIGSTVSISSPLPATSISRSSPAISIPTPSSVGVVTSPSTAISTSVSISLQSSIPSPSVSIASSLSSLASLAPSSIPSISIQSSSLGVTYSTLSLSSVTSLANFLSSTSTALSIPSSVIPTSSLVIPTSSIIQSSSQASSLMLPTSVSVSNILPSVSSLSTNILPSASSTSSNTQISSSGGSSSSAAAPSTSLNSNSPTYSCPANNGSIVPDQNYNIYQIMCCVDTYGAADGVVSASNSFNDCFYACDSTAGCQGFTYSGGANGTGSGLCFLKSGRVGFISGTGDTSGIVAAVKYAGGAYSASLSVFQPSSTSIPTVMSMSSNILSMLPTSSAVVFSSLPTLSTNSLSISLTSIIPTSSLPTSISLPTSSIIFSSSIAIASPQLPSSSSVVISTTATSFALTKSSTSTTSVQSSTLASSTPAQSSSLSSIVAPTYSSSSQQSSSSPAMAQSSSMLPGSSTASSVSSQATSGSSSVSTYFPPPSPSPSTSSLLSSSSPAPSSTSASAPAPSSTGISCPASDQQTVTDAYGVAYKVGCASDTSPAGNYAVLNAPNGFTDCFALCDNSTVNQGVGYCDSFTYAGGANGVGSGQCFLKSISGVTFIPSDVNHVAAIRVTSPNTASSSSSIILSSSIIKSQSSAMISSSLLSSSSSSPAVDPPNVYGSSTGSSGSSTVPSTSSSAVVAASSTPSSSTSSPSVPSSSVPALSTSSVLSITVTPPVYSSMPPVYSSIPPNIPSSSAQGTLSSSVPPPLQYSSSIPPSSTTPTSAKVSSSSIVPTTSKSALPSCPAASCGAQASNQTCADPYGNAFNLVCGTKYTGTLSKRANANNATDCLTTCDTTMGCVAANYDSSNGECDLLSSVNGTTTQPGVAAASRPADVSTVYTMPPSSTSMAVASSTGVLSSTTPPVYGGSTFASLMSSQPGLATVLFSTSSQAPPPYGSPPMTSAGAGTTSSAASPSVPAPATSSPAPGYGTSSQAQSSMASMPGYGMPSSSISMAATTSAVSIPEYGMPTSSMSMSSSTMSMPASYSSQILCPNYDGQEYTDAHGNTYSVECNTAYQGTTIAPLYKRQGQPADYPGARISPQTCMTRCDSMAQCVAANVMSTGLCTLFSSVTSTVRTTGSIALYRVSRPVANISVVTISTCAATATSTALRYTTVQYTTTLSCSAPGMCATMMPGQM